jgi:hypothetical protein
VKATRLGEITLDKFWSSRLGVCREASSLTQEKPIAKKAEQGNAGHIILGRQRHVKRMNVNNWKNVAQDRDRWKEVVERARTLHRL